MDHGTALLTTIVAAVGFGLFAQILAHRWRIPAIVLLLAMGVILGENGLGIVRPEELGNGLVIIVKLAVAIILFEGALNLNLKSLRQSAVEVRNLVTIGVLITWVLVTLIAHFVAGLEWRIAILFGSLLTVTGPTVIQPLMRRISVPRRIKTILEGEAILIDPIGAILAIAVFDVLLAQEASGTANIGGWLWAYFGRLLIGGAIGGLGALGLSLMMKAKRLVPAELSNLVALAAVWFTFGTAESILSDAGIMAVVVMGLIIQNSSLPGERQLRHFKETLTTLGISMLFILLAADLHIPTLLAEGGRGLIVVLLIIFLARPISVFVSTWGSSLNWREKLFISWIGPRGIIAASVASIFAVGLEESGIEGGERLLALTFMTIILTVSIQGLSARWVARILGLQSMEGRKVIIVGANRLGRIIATSLEKMGRPTLLIDTNRSSVAQAQEQGYNAIYGNALKEDALANIHAEDYATLLAITPNSEVNVLACQFASDTFGIRRAFPLLSDPEKGASPKMLNQTGGKLAFGRFVNIAEWEYADKWLNVFEWKVPPRSSTRALADISLPDEVLPVIHARGRDIEIIHADLVCQSGDTVVFITELTEKEAITLIETASKKI